MSIVDKLTTIAENEQRVYEAGKTAQYDAFWDAYQKKGNRQNYASAFSYVGWGATTFKPKYSMQPTNAKNMFYYFNYTDTGETAPTAINLKAIFEERGITLDFSKATDMSTCFQNARITHLGVVDLSSVQSVTGTFTNMYNAKWIDKVIVNENNVFNNVCFSNCYASHIIFEGVIASDLRLPTSSLDDESISSLMDSLKNLKESGIATKTLTLNSATHAKLTQNDIATIQDGKGWSLVVT